MALASNTYVCKQPGETVDLAMDFSTWLATGDTLSLPSVADEENGGGTSDLTITAVAVSGQTVVMRVAGGTQGRYRIEVTVTVSDGQILEGDGTLIVKDK